ncbi:hypothetical protein B2J93_5783 [Marssonina coronariae]|uniref:Uncharacterized protein n=1 Tax=Diplocarpon coronariae TaxID=2795749 RepID=A0A218YXZ7_9HELO|nr:hypothetical protein B2J93_5783 [Marssonina coronariae]
MFISPSSDVRESCDEMTLLILTLDQGHRVTSWLRCDPRGLLPLTIEAIGTAPVQSSPVQARPVQVQVQVQVQTVESRRPRLTGSVIE